MPKQFFKKIFFSFGALSLIIASFAIVHPAQALTISPVKLELSGDPGQTITSRFDLLNEQNSTITFYTSYANFEAQGETGNPSFTQSNDGLDTWIKAPDQIVLAPSEKKTVSFSIAIPKNADPGGHFAAIFFGTAPQNQSGSSQVSIGAKVGILVLLNVSGAVKQGGGILQFGINGNNSAVTELPVLFYFRFQNSGGDRVDPTGDITIKNLFGSTVAKIPANPTNGNILPNSVRKFYVPWSNDPNQIADPAAVPHRSFFKAAGYELRDFRFGKYFVSLVLTDQNGKRFAAPFTFYVLPWQLIVCVIVILAILFFLLRFFIRKYNRWIISQAQRRK